MLIEIKDLSAPELAVYTRPAERRGPFFVAESPLVIGRALDAGYEPVSLLVECRCAAAEALISRCGAIPVYTAEPEVLVRLTGFHLTRGVLCALRRPQQPGLQELCAGARRVAVLENITDPANTGAIFRSAAALGMDAVVVAGTGADPLSRRAGRVRMGAVFQVPWTREAEWLAPLRELGFYTAAMALREDALSLADPRLTEAERLAVVVGTEGSGLRPETIAACDAVVRIPMARGVDSLNAAAAAAVAFYQLGQVSER